MIQMLPMLMEIKYGTRFRKNYIKADKKIKAAFTHAIELFLEQPNHPLLRNHALRKKYAGYRSINVTEDWRAVFKETKSKKLKVVIFHLLGTHDQLYK